MRFRGSPLLTPALALATLASAGAGAVADDPPFPAGISSQELHGLRCSVVMPQEYDLSREHSLVVILHGAGGTETGMAGGLRFLAERDFVVLAPKSRGQVWEKADLDAVRRIVLDLRKRLNIGAGRLHAAGFSNGGWNLPAIAFDEDLRCASACFIAAGFKGGSIPKFARRETGVLALAGEKDGNRPAAEGTPDAVEGKVRSAEVRIQPGKGHEWPDALIPYYGWWLGVQEGRFEPGVTLAFDWVEDEAAARAAMEEKRTGGFVYWYAKEDAGDADAKAFQNEVLQEPLVRRFGGQLAARKRDRAEAGEAFGEAKLKETPAVVVYDAKGRVVKSFSGKVSAAALANALRSVAPDKSLPKR